MDFSSICRTCLSAKHLNPIFVEKIENYSLSSVIFITTGVKVEKNDGYPQQICKNCTKLLNEVQRFRDICKNAEIQLINMKKELFSEISLSFTKNKKFERKKPKLVKIVFGNDDDVPLLQQKLNIIHSDTITNTKPELKQENNNVVLYDGYEKNDEAFNRDYVQEITIATAENDKELHDLNNYSNKLKIDILQNEELQKNMSDESAYETEFLDLNLDSEYEKEIANDINIDNYNLDMTDYDTDVHKNIDLPNDIENVKEYEIKVIKHNKPKKKTKKCIKQIDTNNSNNIKNVIYIKELNTNFESQIKDEEEYLIENTPFLMSNTNRVTCKLCQKDLSVRSIDAHMAKSHPGADSRKEKCDICDTYVLKSRLNRHKSIMHGSDGLTCGYCKTEYESKEMLLEHVSTCHAKLKKRKAVTDKRKQVIVECEICNKTMQKASLRLHKEIKHAGLGPVCEHCGRRFGNKFRLAEHLRAKHGYEKYKCSHCDFLSASSLALKNHERRHRGERPFGCTQCGAKFHAAHLLAQHKQSHRTRRDMKCEQCPAAFKARNTLHMHRLTCHNTNTYQCPMCPRTYGARHYAVKHLRAVHRHTGPVGDLLVRPKEPHNKDT